MNLHDLNPDDPLVADLATLREALDRTAFPGHAWERPRPSRLLRLACAGGLAAAAAAAVFVVALWQEDGAAPTSQTTSPTAGTGLTHSAAWTARWHPPSTARLAALRKRAAARAPVTVPGPPKPVTLAGDPWSTSWKAARLGPSEGTWAERIPRIRFRGAGSSPQEKETK